ncbi:branched-chain amino acid transaminase [Candidatus Aminicenantes bacterium AC-335-A11]|jgi:branched-chain amino acid aminotransferase|nr:branched-chain amino acid transaminase [SCandidatus Aminicenantes bacterium Aminicenantia_JdfR_composite]MCP2598015.1 branched-chain amino acid transaminase [Candidatus Aminicenantes bacterium AC-335-L06]MCP2606158.1 branched-chain amino acid transaminase [Candidatus Aminicenantes bacterium AC-708-I09]MCP2618801.1 branched-chain amino acid transaminase [Candidatus Aminicenantes bacterium AC-335-A11]
MGISKEKGKVWMNGKLIPWEDAKIHIASHVIHYGTSIFEGMRAYDTPKGVAIFRLRDHVERLYNSCKIYRMEIPYSKEEFEKAIIETVKANNKKSCYIRPIVYRGMNSLGVNPFPNPVEAAILVLDWGKYLGEEALEKGVDVKVSSWQRMAPNTFPALAKAGANYMNSQLIKMEAIIDGYSEGIALNVRGHVSEGSGENIFIVKNGILYTPPLSSSILPGITRDTVIKLAQDIGLVVKEDTIPREALYIADEVFFTGSAAEITPVRSIDKIIIGNGKRGKITERLQKEFFAYINGEREDKYNWLTYI